MNKILLITQREFTSRVRKKSFIIMSILAPLLFGGFIALMAYFGEKGDDKIKNIAVIDNSSMFINKIPDNKSLHFEYLSNTKTDDLKKNLKESDYYGILEIDTSVLNNPRATKFYSFSQPGMSTVQHISHHIEYELRNYKLKKYNIANIEQILLSVKSDIDLQTIKLGDKGEEKEGSTEVTMVVAYLGSYLIFLFILLYGVQVMRGVLEEKTNRIVEVMVSSVKPFDLMMGKVLGVALTALLQFIIWIGLTLGILYILQMALLPEIPAGLNQMPQGQPVNDSIVKIFNMIKSPNYYEILGYFLFYFITGYLLYSSLFAAIGAAVDNEADTQQFMMPIMLPLIVGTVIMAQAFQYPDGTIPVWGSIIPFTAPIVMMARIPYEPPVHQIIISMALMILTFLGTIWLAAKIYRTGILMYGKKITFKELLKWLTYKS